MSTITPGQVVSAELLNLLFDAPYFKGSIMTATAIAANANVGFPVIEDSRSAWDVANLRYVIPVAGIYRVIFAAKGTSSPSSLRVIKNGTNAVYGPSLGAAVGGALTASIRCAVGDTISAQVGVAYTTQADAPADNNYLIIQRDRS